MKLLTQTVPARTLAPDADSRIEIAAPYAGRQAVGGRVGERRSPRSAVSNVSAMTTGPNTSSLAIAMDG